jgi:hypothetical protein
VDACELAFSVAAKAAAATISTKAIGLTDVPWAAALNVGAFAALLSLLTSAAMVRRH